MRKILVVLLLSAATPMLGMSAAGAAGTTNGNAGCVARINTVEGPPGPSIAAIKQYLSPVPGALISGVARSDRTNCALPA